jgi:choline dehydrogenase
VPATADGNGEYTEGVARTEMNIVNFTRQRAADAYIGPALERPNLTVVTRAFVRRLVVDEGQCSGVEYVSVRRGPSETSPRRHRRRTRSPSS